MFDRASTFADAEIVEMLQADFIPVAIDQAYQRRQQDAEGEFYRRIASQGPRHDFQNGTTQGFYIATASGDFLLYNNNRNPQRLRQLMREALEDYEQLDEVGVEQIEEGDADERFSPQLPEGGLVLRVRGKILEGYEPTDDPTEQLFHSAISRDNLWMTRAEHEALVDGEVLASLQMRLARFHLVDSTRGEPPMWREDEVIAIEMTLVDGTLRGSVHLQTGDGERGYAAQFHGLIEVEDGEVTKFEMIALGQFHGEGRYTRGAPEGEFTFGVAFTLADGSDAADAIPPQGSRGWLRGYIE